MFIFYPCFKKKKTQHEAQALLFLSNGSQKPNPPTLTTRLVVAGPKNWLDSYYHHTTTNHIIINIILILTARCSHIYTIFSLTRGGTIIFNRNAPSSFACTTRLSHTTLYATLLFFSGKEAVVKKHGSIHLLSRNRCVLTNGRSN